MTTKIPFRSDNDFHTLITHLADKCEQQFAAGEDRVELRIRPETGRRYSGQVGIQLEDELARRGWRVSVRQWTGAGFVGVLSVQRDR